MTRSSSWRRTASRAALTLAICVGGPALADVPPTPQVEASSSASDGLDDARRMARDARTDDEADAARDALRAVIDRADADGRHRALYALAELEEARGDVNAALLAYRASLEAAPNGRYARRAGSRVRALDAAGFADIAPDDLSLLAAIRDGRAGMDEAEARAAVTALAATHTSGTFGADLRLWLGSDARYRADDPVASWRWYIEVLELEGARIERYRVALDSAVMVAGDAGRVSESRAAVRTFLDRYPDLASDDDVAALYDRLVDEEVGRIARGVAAVSLPALLALFAAARGWTAFRRASLERWRPWRVWALLLWMFGGAALIAGAYTEGAFAPIAACGVSAVLMHALASGLQRGARPLHRLPLRVAAAVVVAAASFSAIFLTLAFFDREAFLGL